MKLFKVALYVWDISESWPYGEEVGEEGDQDDNEEDDQNPYLLKAGSMSFWAMNIWNIRLQFAIYIC